MTFIIVITVWWVIISIFGAVSAGMQAYDNDTEADTVAEWYRDELSKFGKLIVGYLFFWPFALGAGFTIFIVWLFKALMLKNKD